MASMMRGGAGAGGNQMMDLIKANMMMNSKESPIWTFFIMTFLEFIMKYVGILMAVLQKYMEKWFDDKFKKKLENLPITRGANGQEENEIIFVRHYGGKAKPDAFVTVDAVLMQILKVEEIKKMVYSNATYMINCKDIVSVTKEVKFQLIGSEFGEDGEVSSLRFRLFTDNAGIQELKQYVVRCERDYEIVKKNKLGNDLFFFDHILPPSDDDGTPGSGGGGAQIFQNQVVFTRNLFLTNRTLDNVFFEQKKEVSTRLDIFLNRKDWYDKRGIPHTLGFLLHGSPGTGKTSSIKAVANMTKRHIINVNLGRVLKKSHLKQLFYDEKIWVLEKGEMGEKLESYIIPIHKRLYVMEDIDATEQSVLFKRNMKELKKMEGQYAKAEMEKLLGGKIRMNKIIHKEDSDEVNELVELIHSVGDLISEFERLGGDSIDQDDSLKDRIHIISKIMACKNELVILQEGKHCTAWIDICGQWIRKCQLHGDKLKQMHEKWIESQKSSQPEMVSAGQDTQKMITPMVYVGQGNGEQAENVEHGENGKVYSDILDKFKEIGTQQELANYLGNHVSDPISLVEDLEKRGVNVLKLNGLFQEYEMINPSSIYYGQLDRMTEYQYLGEDDWKTWIENLDHLINRDRRLMELYSVFGKMRNIFDKCLDKINELRKQEGKVPVGEKFSLIGTAGLLAHLEGKLDEENQDEGQILDDVCILNKDEDQSDDDKKIFDGMKLDLELSDSYEYETEEEMSAIEEMSETEEEKDVEKKGEEWRSNMKEVSEWVDPSGVNQQANHNLINWMGLRGNGGAVKKEEPDKDDMNSGLDAGGILYADVTGKIGGKIKVNEFGDQQIKLATGEDTGDPFSEVMGMMMGCAALGITSRDTDDVEDKGPTADSQGIGSGWHPSGTLTGGRSMGGGSSTGGGGGRGGRSMGGGGGDGDKKEKDEDEVPDGEKVDLSCILNILDGTLETPGRIIMITSNYPEKLDHALIRPGRIDLILEFKKANHSVLAEMYECFFEDKADLAEIGRIDEYKWSPAEVSQIMFKNYNDPNHALDDLANQDPKEYFKFSHFHRDSSSSNDVVM